MSIDCRNCLPRRLWSFFLSFQWQGESLLAFWIRYSFVTVNTLFLPVWPTLVQDVNRSVMFRKKCLDGLPVMLKRQTIPGHKRFFLILVGFWIKFEKRCFKAYYRPLRHQQNFLSNILVNNFLSGFSILHWIKFPCLVCSAWLVITPLLTAV